MKQQLTIICFLSIGLLAGCEYGGSKSVHSSSLSVTTENVKKLPDLPGNTLQPDFAVQALSAEKSSDAFSPELANQSTQDVSFLKNINLVRGHDMQTAPFECCADTVPAKNAAVSVCNRESCPEVAVEGASSHEYLVSAFGFYNNILKKDYILFTEQNFQQADSLLQYLTERIFPHHQDWHTLQDVSFSSVCQSIFDWDIINTLKSWYFVSIHGAMPDSLRISDSTSAPLFAKSSSEHIIKTRYAL